VTQQVEVPQGARRPVRQLVAASIGNAVEWCDWYAYTFMATYFSG
jgi:MFS transporter, MHS family, alpha-ketoglutarate permease